MDRFSVPAEDEESLHDLVDRALAGDEVVITRGGKPIAELRPIHDAGDAEPPAGSLEWLRKRAMARPAVNIKSVDLLNEMYEEED
jgi:antitoxin (DNA-binding transcriptional repressor) of toxin-antitoxin stability system